MPKWTEQKAGVSINTFVSHLRAKIFHDVSRCGKFNITDLDHKSESYAGISNKTLKILAGNIRQRDLDYNTEAVPLIMARVLGLPDPVDHVATQRKDRIEALLHERAAIDAELEELQGAKVTV